MKKLFALLAAFCLVVSGTSLTRAANMLVNGDLDDPGTHEVDLATGWTLQEFRTTTGPGDTATFASFANHTPNPNAPGADPDTSRVGAWYKNFSGTPTNTANANLYQDVPGTPGVQYVMTGWARFEQFFAGGLNQVPSIDPITGEFVLSPSITKMVFALDFLGAGDSVINSVVRDLHDDDGQINNNQWVQHTVLGTAPAGTLKVRVRSSAIDMLATFGSQSAFADDFSLDVVPEPASIALVLIGLCGTFGVTRRR